MCPNIADMTDISDINDIILKIIDRYRTMLSRNGDFRDPQTQYKTTKSK